MNRRWTARCLLFATIITGFALLRSLVVAQAPAQRPRPSQHGSLRQQIADTRITIEYNRPVARGRELFGKLVPWKRT